MKTVMHKLRAATGFFLLAGLMSSGSQAIMPSEEYACQVQAEGGRQGLVLVQTDTRKMAFDTALHSTAKTIDGTRRRVVAVVECIHRPEERFRDTTFQKFFESVPL